MIKSLIKDVAGFKRTLSTLTFKMKMCYQRICCTSFYFLTYNACFILISVSRCWNLFYFQYSEFILFCWQNASLRFLTPEFRKLIARIASFLASEFHDIRASRPRALYAEVRTKRAAYPEIPRDSCLRGFAPSLQETQPREIASRFFLLSLLFFFLETQRIPCKF